MRRTKHRRRYFTGKVISRRKRQARMEGSDELPNGMLEVRGHYEHMSQHTRHQVSKAKRNRRKSRRRRESADLLRLREEYQI